MSAALWVKGERALACPQIGRGLSNLAQWRHAVNQDQGHCRPVPAINYSQQRCSSTGTKKESRQVLKSNDMIRYNGTNLLLPKTTADDKRQFAAGRKFFQKGYKFLYSAEVLAHHARNEHVPEIVILGASNVGKSSFLNALVGRQNAARVSHRPGKTTTMNAYGVGPVPKIPLSLIPRGTNPPEHSLIIMDTPGYGYKSQAGWGDAIVEYLKGRPMLRGAVVLLSSEKRLLKEDKWLLRTLAESNTRTTVILTKADKHHNDWTIACSTLAASVQDEMRTLSSHLQNGWREGSGYSPDVYITAASMDSSTLMATGAGIGGARAAILEMAGYNTTGEVAQKDENVEYSGKVVSFDDIPWKT